MKSSDVRIGNIVVFGKDAGKGADWIPKIIGNPVVIDLNIFEEIQKDGWYEPIKLTKEILIKVFDFYEESIVQKIGWIVYKGDFRVFCIDSEMSFGKKSNGKRSFHICNIEYLHDLQNIWYLLNGKQELEIDIEKLKLCL